MLSGAAIPAGEELLACVSIRPGEDAHCECGRRVLTADDLGGFAGTLAVELRCPRCPAKVIVTISAEA